MVRKTALTSAALVLAAAVTLSAQTKTAEAAEGWQIGLGIAGGLAAGAIIGSTLAQPRYAAPPVYYAPRAYRPVPRTYHQAPVVSYRPAPWSPSWYNYCSSKYRSFNPRTGYYLAYSGRYRFCR